MDDVHEELAFLRKRVRELERSAASPILPPPVTRSVSRNGITLYVIPGGKT